MGNQKRQQIYSKRYPGVFWYEPYPKVEGRTFYVAYQEHGKRYRERIGTESEGIRERTAYQVREQRRVKERLGEPIQGRRSTPTLDRIFVAFLKWAQGNKKTWKNDLRLYRRRIAPKFGDWYLDQITHAELEQFRLELQKAKGPNGDLLRPATVKHYMILIRRLINFAIDNGEYQGDNPFRLIKFKKLNNKVTEVLTVEQSRSLLKVLENYDDRSTANLIRFAYYTGLRRSEVFNLKWDDVLFEQRLIVLREPKSGENEIYPPNEVAWSILQEQQSIVHDSEFVFPGRFGKGRVEIKKAWAKVRERAGIEESFRFHGLRHNFASQLASNPEVSSYTLQAVMRHKDHKTTQRYIDIDADQRRKAAELFLTSVNK